MADFVRVEDQNFALFNYVTEMNNQARRGKNKMHITCYSKILICSLPNNIGGLPVETIILFDHLLLPVLTQTSVEYRLGQTQLYFVFHHKFH